MKWCARNAELVWVVYQVKISVIQTTWQSSQHSKSEKISQVQFINCKCLCRENIIHDFDIMLHILHDGITIHYCARWSSYPYLTHTFAFAALCSITYFINLTGMAPERDVKSFKQLIPEAQDYLDKGIEKVRVLVVLMAYSYSQIQAPIQAFGIWIRI